MNNRIPPPVVAIVAGILIWILSLALPTAQFQFMGKNWVAAFFAILGFAIDVVASWAFFKHKTTVNPMRPANANRLVTDGLYKYSRNPMYVGQLLVLIGFALWLGNLASIVIIAVFVWFLTKYQIMPEETVMHEKFGQDFEEYAKRVRRWL